LVADAAHSIICVYNNNYHAIVQNFASFFPFTDGPVGHEISTTHGIFLNAVNLETASALWKNGTSRNGNGDRNLIIARTGTREDEAKCYLHMQENKENSHEINESK
jgi:hypothetical protein